MSRLRIKRRNEKILAMLATKTEEGDAEAVALVEAEMLKEVEEVEEVEVEVEEVEVEEVEVEEVEVEETKTRKNAKSKND
jgi:hypothetical protein